MGDFLFGSSGQAPQAFRSPGWEQQGQALNDLFMANLYGANPQMAQGNAQYINNLQSQIDALQSSGYQGGIQSGPYAQRMAGAQGYGVGSGYTQGAYNQQLAQLQNELSRAQAMQSQIDAYGQNPAYAPLPELQFSERSPYQYTTNFDPEKALGDAFTPEYERLTRITAERGGKEREAILEDMNRRGLLTAGGTTEALMTQRQTEEDRLANALAGLSADQARQKLGAYQYASNLDLQRQQSQAEELFRQSGASDAQAQQLAQYAMQKRGFENQLQRQPIEDLLRLYSYSTGAQPGYEGSPGLFQSIAPTAAKYGMMALL